MANKGSQNPILNLSNDEATGMKVARILLMSWLCADRTVLP